MTPADWCLALLLVPGCLYWLGLAVIGVRVRAAVPRLIDRRPPEPERWPRVSLVVPACDEAETLEAAVRSRLAEGYPDLQVVLVDDRSTDGTGALVDALAASDPRVVAVHVSHLPEGWLGKNHAQHVGAQAADGEWLLFSDADVHLEPGALRRAVAFALERDLDHLALLPDIEGAGLPLESVLAVFGRTFALGTRMWSVNDPETSATVGVGAFNLVRAAALAATPGFPWLRLDVGDDLALALLIRHHGGRCGLASGHALVHLRWYASVRALAAGFEKNVFSVVGDFRLGRLALLAAVVWLLECGPFLAALPFGPTWLTVLGLCGLAVVLLNALGLARWAGRQVLPVVLAPLGATLMVWVMLRAGWLGHRRGGVLWRGTLYPTELLRDAMRYRM